MRGACQLLCLSCLGSARCAPGRVPPASYRAQGRPSGPTFCPLIDL
ncbi:hypothetical protein COLSTE_02051 [Collinsella stercoris DSM 13279]|uniref:Uncharacterized protein n=1 Tax=Collinsella stercoris DSM 13279 TaxID=445975 RepID=B6GD74_9ACTN|nr:hypothetical protein COLSTE_02051 [Collinsella stercoris DSM 13279]